MYSIGIALLAVLAAFPAIAAEDEWEHTAVIYMIGASIDGRAGVGPVTADVDVGFDDILDNLDAGAMAAYRAQKGRWAVVADLIYMGLEQDKDGLGPLGQARATAELDQLVFELDGSYAVNERVDVYAGVRYWDIDSEVVIVGGGPLGETLRGSAGEHWIDPIVGIRYTWNLGDAWSIVWRGDVGGLGIGSDFTWHTTAYANWRFGEHASLAVGFRYLDVDYEDGTGSDRFLMDVG